MPDEENREILNTLAKGAGITAFGMFFSKAITYFYRALVGRALGPEAYGQLSIGMMIVGIAATLSGDPVRNGLKKFIPEFREDNDKASIKGIVISALEINLIGSLLVGGTIFFSAEFIAVQIFESAALIPIIQVFGLVPIIGRPYDIFIDTTIAFNKAKYKVISTNIAQNLVQLAATAAFIYIGMDVMGAVWGWVAGVAFTLPLAYYFMEKKVGPVLTEKVKAQHHRKKLFKFSYPLMLSGIIGTMMGWTDTAFLGYFMNESAVGLYNAAFPTALLLTIPHLAFGQLAISSFSQLGAEGKSQGKTLKTAARWVFALTFPTFLIMVLYSTELLTLLFGSQYSSAGLALSILAFGNLFNAASGRVGSVLISNSHTKFKSYNTVVNFSANILLNIILIPAYGILGAAIATTAANILGNALSLWGAWHFEEVHPFSRQMAKTLIAGLIALVAVYSAFNLIFNTVPYWSLIPAAATFYSLYFIIYGKIGGLTNYDKEIIRTIGRKVNRKDFVKKLIKILT